MGVERREREIEIERYRVREKGEDKARKGVR